MNNKKIFSAVAVALATSLTLAACGAVTTTEELQVNDDITIADEVLVDEPEIGDDLDNEAVAVEIEEITEDEVTNTTDEAQAPDLTVLDDKFADADGIIAGAELLTEFDFTAPENNLLSDLADFWAFARPEGTTVVYFSLNADGTGYRGLNPETWDLQWTVTQENGENVLVLQGPATNNVVEKWSFEVNETDLSITSLQVENLTFNFSRATW